MPNLATLWHNKTHPRKPTLPLPHIITYRVAAMASTVDDTTEAVSNLTMETEGTMSKDYIGVRLWGSNCGAMGGSDHRSGGNPF
ncbi:unnamed protein product [Prunus armeniaca]